MIQPSPLPTSTVFAPGHRIRIEVYSSNFPRFTRNLNTGGNIRDETEGGVANNAVPRPPCPRLARTQSHPPRHARPVPDGLCGYAFAGVEVRHPT